MTTRAVNRLVMFVAINVISVSASADQCATQPPKWRFKGADAVFLGTVLEGFGGFSALRVDEAFKGTSRGQVVNTVPSSTFTFQMHFRPGKSYLVYASKTGDGDTFLTSTCETREVPPYTCELELVRARHSWWLKRISNVRVAHLLPWRLQRKLGCQPVFQPKGPVAVA